MGALVSLLILAAIAACGTTKDNPIQKTPTSAFDAKFGALKTKQKINYLQKYGARNGYSPELKASIESLKNGGSDETAAAAAKLEAQRVYSGLNDDDNLKLKFLKRGSSPRQAELEVKEQKKTISEGEKTELMNIRFPPEEAKKSDAPVVAPDRHVIK